MSVEDSCPTLCTDTGCTFVSGPLLSEPSLGQPPEPGDVPGRPDPGVNHERSHGAAPILGAVVARVHGHAMAHAGDLVGLDPRLTGVVAPDALRAAVDVTHPRRGLPEPVYV